MRFYSKGCYFKGFYFNTGLAAVLITLGGAGLAPAAHADDTLTLLNVNGSTSVDLTFINGSGGTDTFDNVAAGEYNISLNGGASQSAFCTDLWNEDYLGESWDVDSYQTSAPDGLASAAAFYPVAPENINAIDYIGENYAGANSATQAAAQIAIWDLVVGGTLTLTAPNTYAWSSQFSETGVSDSSVYTIEEAALAASGPQGSQWLEVVDGTQNPSTDGRPQDFVISTPAEVPQVPAVPEPSSLLPFAFAALGLGALMLRARRRMPTA